MNSFHYFCPTRIEMGMGKAKQLPELLESLQVGKSIMFRIRRRSGCPLFSGGSRRTLRYAAWCRECCIFAVCIEI